jgi:Arc/MetJ family transcription regulator
MRTTLNIDDALLREARRLSGIAEKTALVHAGLEALVARESARRLAALGGSEPRLSDVPRRRPAEPAAARRRVLASRRKPRGTR